MLFVFQFYPVCNFGTFINFGLLGVIGFRVHFMSSKSKLDVQGHFDLWKQVLT